MNYKYHENWANHHIDTASLNNISLTVDSISLLLCALNQWSRYFFVYRETSIQLVKNNTTTCMYMQHGATLRRKTARSNLSYSIICATTRRLYEGCVQSPDRTGTDRIGRNNRIGPNFSLILRFILAMISSVFSQINNLPLLSNFVGDHIAIFSI